MLLTYAYVGVMAAVTTALVLAPSATALSFDRAHSYPFSFDGSVPAPAGSGEVWKMTLPKSGDIMGQVHASPDGVCLLSTTSQVSDLKSINTITGKMFGAVTFHDDPDGLHTSTSGLTFLNDGSLLLMAQFRNFRPTLWRMAWPQPRPDTIDPTSPMDTLAALRLITRTVPKSSFASQGVSTYVDTDRDMVYITGGSMLWVTAVSTALWEGLDRLWDFGSPSYEMSQSGVVASPDGRVVGVGCRLPRQDGQAPQADQLCVVDARDPSNVKLAAQSPIALPGTGPGARATNFVRLSAVGASPAANWWLTAVSFADGDKQGTTLYGFASQLDVLPPANNSTSSASPMLKKKHNMKPKHHKHADGPLHVKQVWTDTLPSAHSVYTIVADPAWPLVFVPDRDDGIVYWRLWSGIANKMIGGHTRVSDTGCTVAAVARGYAVVRSLSRRNTEYTLGVLHVDFANTDGRHGVYTPQVYAAGVNFGVTQAPSVVLDSRLSAIVCWQPPHWPQTDPVKPKHCVRYAEPIFDSEGRVIVTTRR